MERSKGDKSPILPDGTMKNDAKSGSHQLSLSDTHSPFVPPNTSPDQSSSYFQNMRATWKDWRRDQVVPCLLIFTAFTGQSMCMMMVGPSLLDLMLLTNTTISQSSWFLSVRALGALLGSLLLSKTFELQTRWYQLSASVFVSGLAFIIIPWVPNFPAVIIMFLLFGAGMGYFMTGGMLSVFSIWTDRTDSVSWFNGGQLMLVFGGILGPLVVRPFFATNYIDHGNSTDINNITDPLLSVPDFEIDPTATPLPPGSNTYIMYAFLIAGLYTIICSIIMLIGDYCMGGISFVARNPMNTAVHTRRRLLPLKSGLVIVLFLFHVVTGIIVRIFAAYIVTFTVNYFGWSKEQGSLLTAFTFMAAIVGKIACIFIVRVIKTEVQLFAGLIINIFGALLMLFFIDKFSWIIWISCAIIAFGDANVTATILGWTDKYIGLKGLIGALFNIGQTMGEIIAPPLVGWLFTEISYASFIYLIAFCACADIVFMVGLHLMGIRYQKLVALYGAEEEVSEENTLLHNEGGN